MEGFSIKSEKKSFLNFHPLINVIQAPEMVKGEVVGPPADIWTVGIVTYIM